MPNFRLQTLLWEAREVFLEEVMLEFKVQRKKQSEEAECKRHERGGQREVCVERGTDESRPQIKTEPRDSITTLCLLSAIIFQTSQGMKYPWFEVSIILQNILSSPLLHILLGRRKVSLT